MQNYSQVNVEQHTRKINQELLPHHRDGASSLRKYFQQDG